MREQPRHHDGGAGCNTRDTNLQSSSLCVRTNVCVRARLRDRVRMRLRIHVCVRMGKVAWLTPLPIHLECLRRLCASYAWAMRET